MHRVFKELLPDAKGLSEFIIAIFLDVRGFAEFSKTVDSADVGVYIKKVYTKILDEYFPEAEYFKPTGDGLLVVKSYREEDCKERIAQTVLTCMKLLNDFSIFFVGDAMINFETPRQIGIGISRGSACCIEAKSKKLDYSGKVLNLAARLLDLARPSGIVFDSAFGIEHLPPDLQQRFAQEKVYIRGIAESIPINVYLTKDYTKISAINKHPIREVEWNEQIDVKKFKIVKNFDVFTYALGFRPLDEEQISVQLVYPDISENGERVEGVVATNTLKKKEFYFEYLGAKPQVNIRFKDLIGQLNEARLTDDTDIKIRIIYPKYPTSIE